MKEADQKSPGAMAAILALDVDAVRDICERAAAQTGGVLVLANDNCPGQVVISGSEEALQAGIHLAKQAGAKRAIRLQISIAAHSPLMESAAEELRRTLAVMPFQPPHTAVMGNNDVQLLDNVQMIRHALGRQLTGPVRWTGTIQAMIDAGAQTFLELGPKDVLTGLLKRIDRDKTGVALNSVSALHQFAQNSVYST
jgi:[acyl-carrier-protein] S-malonyltransferase